MRFPGRLRGGTAALAVLALFSAILLAPALVGGRALFPRDARTAIPWRYHADPALENALRDEPANDLLTDKNVFDFPKLHLAYRLWSEDGELPLWNPCTFAGNPLLATAMPSPLYPGNLLFLLDPYRGFAWTAALHLVLSGLFLHAYLRSLGCGFLAGLLGGTAYAFSGWYLAHLNLPSYLYAATWFPLMLLAAERLARGGGGLRWWTALVGGTALAGLAGFPPVAALAVAATGLYVLARVPRVRRERGNQRAFRFAAVSGLGLVLGPVLIAFQLWPTVELARSSGRADLDRATVAEGALRPLGLLGLGFPDFFGNPVDRGGEPLLPRTLGLDGPAAGPTNNYLENAHYLGWIPLLLALFALGRPPRGPALFWLAVAAVALLAVTAVPPLDGLLASVPVLTGGNAKRALFLFTAAGAVLAGLGADSLARRQRPGLRPALFAALALLPVVLILAVPGLLARALAGLAAIGDVSPHEITDAGMAAWLDNTRWCLLRAAAPLVPCVALLWLARRRAGPALLAGLILLTFLDLLWFGRRFNPMHRPDQLAVTPGIAFLAREHGPPFRVARFGRVERAHLVLPPNLGMVYGLQDVQGWDVLFPARYQRFMNRIEPGVAREHHLVGPFLRPESLRSPLLDLLGARYVLSHQDWGPEPVPGIRRAYPLAPDGSLLADRLAREGLVIYENTRALPRAFAPPEVLRVPDEEAAFAAMAAPGFDPSRTAVVEGPAPVPAVPVRAADVRITTYRARCVEVEVAAGGPAVLVLTDAWHPGWTAHHGERPLPIRRAYGAFRAVDLPARDAPARITFRFPGRRFRQGAAFAAAAGLLVVAAVALVLVRRRRRDRLAYDAAGGRNPTTWSSE